MTTFMKIILKRSHLLTYTRAYPRSLSLNWCQCLTANITVIYTKTNKSTRSPLIIHLDILVVSIQNLSHFITMMLSSQGQNWHPVENLGDIQII